MAGTIPKLSGIGVNETSKIPSLKGYTPLCPWEVEMPCNLIFLIFLSCVGATIHVI